MSTAKLDHVPLLENAQTFDEWKHFISHVLCDEGYWGHGEGTNNVFDRYPISICPAPCDVTSSIDDISAYQEWWRKDGKACGLLLRRVSPVIIKSFYKFKVISLYSYFPILFVHTCRPTIVLYLCEKAKELAIPFVSYELIVVGAF
jgi:hypothetical protein